MLIRQNALINNELNKKKNDQSIKLTPNTTISFNKMSQNTKPRSVELTQGVLYNRNQSKYYLVYS